MKEVFYISALIIAIIGAIIIVRWFARFISRRLNPWLSTLLTLIVTGFANYIFDNVHFHCQHELGANKSKYLIAEFC